MVRVKRKTAFLTFGAILILLLVCAMAFLTMYDSRPTSKLGDATFHLSVMRTDSQRQKGLSGTQSLREGDAMLFVFPSDDQWAIWMKDMNYPIDIAWLDSNRVVRYVIPNAQPSSYPSTIYRPSPAVRYVLEMPAGTLASKRITIGSEATFNGL